MILDLHLSSCGASTLIWRISSSSWAIRELGNEKIREFVKIVEDVEIVEVDYLAHSSQEKPDSQIGDLNTASKRLNSCG